MYINGFKNSTNFTGTIPVRVFIDGMETANPKEIKAAARQLTTLLAGPIEENGQTLQIAKKFAQRDSEYNLAEAIRGLVKRNNCENLTPSNFFRLITDSTGRFFLLTGAQSKKLAELGKGIGQEKSNSVFYNVKNSFDLMVAKRKYRNYVQTCLDKSNLRLTEGYNPQTKEKLGAPVVLNIQMDSNQKYGKSTFKTFLRDIFFTK